MVVGDPCERSTPKGVTTYRLRTVVFAPPATCPPGNSYQFPRQSCSSLCSSPFGLGGAEAQFQRRPHNWSRPISTFIALAAVIGSGMST